MSVRVYSPEEVNIVKKICDDLDKEMISNEYCKEGYYLGCTVELNNQMIKHSFLFPYILSESNKDYTIQIWLLDHDETTFLDRGYKNIVSDRLIHIRDQENTSRMYDSDLCVCKIITGFDRVIEELHGLCQNGDNIKG